MARSLEKKPRTVSRIKIGPHETRAKPVRPAPVPRYALKKLPYRWSFTSWFAEPRMRKTGHASKWVLDRRDCLPQMNLKSDGRATVRPLRKHVDELEWNPLHSSFKALLRFSRLHSKCLDSKSFLFPLRTQNNSGTGLHQAGASNFRSLCSHGGLGPKSTASAPSLPRRLPLHKIVPSQPDRLVSNERVRKHSQRPG